MSQKVRISANTNVLNVPVSDLSQVIQEPMGADTEAIVTRNKETVGVFMSVARRNALAKTEGQLHAAMLYIDMLAAGRTVEDIERSASQVKARQGSSAADFLAELDADG
jgi:hypothetical protein